MCDWRLCLLDKGIGANLVPTCCSDPISTILAADWRRKLRPPAHPKAVVPQLVFKSYK